MADWPASLPQNPMKQGYSESPPNTVQRTNMDAGPPKVRRRFTAGVRPFNMDIKLSPTQTETLDVFYNSTTNGGADPFTWKHPRTGITVSFRFIAPPEYTPTSGNKFIASLALEVLP